MPKKRRVLRRNLWALFGPDINSFFEEHKQLIDSSWIKFTKLHAFQISVFLFQGDLKANMSLNKIDKAESPLKDTKSQKLQNQFEQAKFDLAFNHYKASQSKGKNQRMVEATFLTTGNFNSTNTLEVINIHQLYNLEICRFFYSKFIRLSDEYNQIESFKKYNLRTMLALGLENKYLKYGYKTVLEDKAKKLSQHDNYDEKQICLFQNLINLGFNKGKCADEQKADAILKELVPLTDKNISIFLKKELEEKNLNQSPTNVSTIYKSRADIFKFLDTNPSPMDGQCSSLYGQIKIKEKVEHDYRFTISEELEQERIKNIAKRILSVTSKHSK
jgi:hypothetical protein